MQAAIMIERSEWETSQKRLTELEAWRDALIGASKPAADPIYNSEEAAQYLGVHPESIRRARRALRLTAVKVNERDYGYRKSELDRYVKRHMRHDEI